MSSPVRRTQPSVLSLVTLFLLALVGSCTEERVTGPPSTPTASQGNLLVTVITTGGDPDYDGYRLMVDHADVDRLSASSTRTLPLNPGEHAVELADLAQNCLPVGSNARTVQIQEGGQTATTFNVDCPHLGAMQVFAGTTGNTLSVKKFYFFVDGQLRDSLAPNESRTFPFFRPGSYVVNLLAVGANCRSEFGISQTVVVGDGALGVATFSMTCTERTDDLPGDKLLVSRTEPGSTHHQLLLMTAGGEAPEVLVDAPAGDLTPDVAANGTKLLYLKWSPSGNRIAVIDRATRVETVLSTSSVSRAVLSPDGTRVAYVREGGIYIIGVDGLGNRQLTNGWNDHDPYWSPDGSTIAFSRDNAAYLIPAAGGNITTVGSGLRSAGPFSPDGVSMIINRLIETNCRPYSYYWYYYGTICDYIPSGILVYNLITRAEQSVVEAPPQQRWSPAWAGDGHSIFFITTTTSNLDIFRVGLDGSAPVNVTHSNAAEQWVAVVPGPGSPQAAARVRRP